LATMGRFESKSRRDKEWRVNHDENEVL